MTEKSIKKSLLALFGEIIDFIKKDFNLPAYIFGFAFIVTTLILNYTTHFYRDLIRPSYFSGDSWWVMPIFYNLIYFAVAIPTLYFRRDYRILRNPVFFVKSSFFVTLYGLAVGFFAYNNLSLSSLFAEERFYILMILSQIKCAVFFIIPLLILKLTIDKNVNGFYGIARHPKHIRAYFMLFAFLIPFLILISFTPDFLQAYPQFQPWFYHSVFGMTTWEYTFIYEITYSLDFIMTELLFRGTLIVGMMLIMGRSAVLPMVAFYCSIHFGKPMAEAISSIFGGYILGALAYQTRHIWGGIMVHICIALTMEIMGFVHYYILKN